MAVEEQLNALFKRFTEEARAIDPSITRCWIMSDETKETKTPNAVFFERPGLPFLTLHDKAEAA